MTKHKLKVCPFCNGAKIFIYRKEGTYHVWCGSCNATGPMESYRGDEFEDELQKIYKKARDGWNNALREYDLEVEAHYAH